MEPMQLRKLQMTGGASYTVSLPKNWVKQQGLKMGDVVSVLERPDSSLTIAPHSKLPSGEEKASEITLTPTKEQERDEILRNLVAQYLAGYDVLRIRFPASARADVRTYLKEAARRMFVGAEIIEESKDELIVQCISSYSDFPTPRVIARMSLIAKLMLRDAVDALRNRDRGLAEEVVKRDDEVDRFYLFIVRQLTLAVLSRSVIQQIGLSDPRDCLVYRVVSKGLERVADHAAGIAKLSETLRTNLPPRLADELSKVSGLASTILDDALKALFRVDAPLANKSIESAKTLVKEAEALTARLFELKLDPQTVVALRMALESLKRTAEYSQDISEMAINLTARRQELFAYTPKKERTR